VSAAELGGSAHSATELKGRSAGVSHLLAADEALSPGRWSTHITLCGAELSRPSTTAVARDEDSEWSPEDVRYCPECVREAHRWVGDVSTAGEVGTHSRESGSA